MIEILLNLLSMSNESECAQAVVRLMVVHCCSGEMILENGSIVPCAIKRVLYTTPRQQEKAHCEMAALHSALGLPNLVQCLAARSCLSYLEPANIAILTECAPILLVSDVTLLLPL